MPLRRLAIILIALLVLGEVTVALWKYLPVKPSTAPVFSLPMMDDAMKQPGEFQRAVNTYQADRGGELKLNGTDGTSLTLFYFEWDQIRMGPMMNVAGHVPEQCNVAAGFKFMGVENTRTFAVAGHPPLPFDCTRFQDPAGRDVFMFRIGWVQGYGPLELRQGLNRTKRLKDSFLRNAGAARVLQAGVFDARDPDHAWQSFRTQVLDHLKW